MQSSPDPPSAEARGRVFPRTRFIVLLSLTILLVACFVVAWETRDVMVHLPSRAGQPGSTAQNASLVDTSPWTTAQTLAAMAATAEEKEYAREAEHLADHSVDQAFAAALRRANLETQQGSLTGAALALSQKVNELKQFVAQDQEAVNRLAASAKGAKPGAADDNTEDDPDLGIAKAQLNLDSDELAELAQSLQEAEGDKGAEIKAELEAHESTMKAYDAQASQPAETAVVAVSRNGTLAKRLESWFRQNTRIQMLKQAQQQAQAKVDDISAAQKEIQAQLDAVASTPVFAGDAKGRLAKIQARSARRQLLSIYDDRVQTQQRLGSVYEKWATQVGRQHRIVIHLIVNSCAWVLGILLAMVLATALMRRLMRLSNLEARDRHTLRAVLGLSINVVGFGCVLLVIFGAPSQIGTILGLATAALTIVLQDFLLAFLGWFKLIGKRGLRVGDTVEIDGVSGEVTDIGLMATTLLETGSLGERGYPTGRRITLMNGYAIRGKYFNFSTAGQWMWDQFEVTIPEALDRSLMLEKVLKEAEEETAANARHAEEEWRRASSGGDLGNLRAHPTVNLLPSVDGRTIEVRYVTSASDRAETRARLYQRVLEILRREGNAVATPPESAAKN